MDEDKKTLIMSVYNGLNRMSALVYAIRNMQVPDPTSPADITSYTESVKSVAEFVSTIILDTSRWVSEVEASLNYWRDAKKEQEEWTKRQMNDLDWKNGQLEQTRQQVRKMERDLVRARYKVMSLDEAAHHILNEAANSLILAGLPPVTIEHAARVLKLIPDNKIEAIKLFRSYYPYGDDNRGTRVDLKVAKDAIEEISRLL